MGQIEIDIAEYLLNHGETIKEQFSSRCNGYYHMLPDALYDIYLDSYKESLINHLKNQISVNLSLQIDEVNVIIDYQYCYKILGQNFFSP